MAFPHAYVLIWVLVILIYKQVRNQVFSKRSGGPLLKNNKYYTLI